MNRHIHLYVILATLGTSMLPAQTSDVNASKTVPRTSDGKPDFSGFFNLQYTPNMAMGKEDQVPYTAAGKAAYANHDAKDDPTSNCWLPGVPRIMQSPYPTQESLNCTKRARPESFSQTATTRGHPRCLVRAKRSRTIPDFGASSPIA